MEADGQGLHKGEETRSKSVIQDQFIGREHDLFRKSTVLLDAQRTVIAAGIHATLTARRACAAAGVRKDDDAPAWLIGGRDVRSDLDDLAADLVPWNPRQCHERVETSKRVEITSADADMTDGNADITVPELLARDIGKAADAFTFDQQSFHVKIPFPE
jgi:hypothetical protein